jgi:hypothetical protein
VILEDHLEALGEASRKFPPPLDPAKIVEGQPARRQRTPEQIGHRHRVLEGEIAPHPPSGDIAWAASPMQSSPGRYQRRCRSSFTVSNLSSSQDSSHSYIIVSKRLLNTAPSAFVAPARRSSSTNCG